MCYNLIQSELGPIKPDGTSSSLIFCVPTNWKSMVFVVSGQMSKVCQHIFGNIVVKAEERSAAHRKQALPASKRC